MDDIDIVVCTSIDQIDACNWDSIGEEIYNTHDYLRAVEKSGVNDLTYRYYLFYRGTELIGHVSVAIFVFGLDIMMPQGMQKYVNRIKTLFPKFLQVKVIECGHPTALGSSIVVASESDRAEVLRILSGELEKLAREQRTSLIDLRDVYSKDQRVFDRLIPLGYRSVPNMSNTFIRIYQRSFEEYLDDLTSKRRHEIVRRMRIFEDTGCTVEKVYDFAPLADELEQLWKNTYDRAKEYQREVLNADYFRMMSRDLGEKSFVLACKQAGRLIGFTMLLESGDTLVSTYCGLDYAVNRQTYSYFMLFYRSIEEAIAMGKEWLELGVTNYNPKIEVGAIPEPMYIYAKSTNVLLNQVLVPLLRALDTPPNFNKRKVFNNRFYERHSITGDLRISAGRETFRIIDLSMNGLGTVGEKKPRGKRISLRIEVSDRLFIPMSGRLKNAERLANGTWRAGYLVKPKSPGHVLLWQNLVERYSAELKA